MQAGCLCLKVKMSLTRVITARLYEQFDVEIYILQTLVMSIFSIKVHIHCMQDLWNLLTKAEYPSAFKKC